jgi:tetratricopeptide (TPR) repeat protein
MIVIWIRRIFGRVFNRGAAMELAFTALCLWSTFLQFQYRVPGLLPFFILPWLGFALTAFGSLSLIVRLLDQTRTKDSLLREMRLLQHLHQAVLVMFITYSVVLYFNCSLDTSTPVEYKSVMLDMSEGEFDIGGFISYSRADLQSWRDRSRTEPVLLYWNEKRSLWIKEPVLVKVREGANGISWIESIEADEEVRMQQVLKLAPTAASAWKNLVSFYLEKEKWDDAVKTTLDYFQYYPDDFQMFGSVADTLFTYRKFRAAVKVLDPVVTHRFHFDTHYLAAWTLGQYKDPGDQERALQLARVVVEMQPDNPLSHYLIGYVYYWMNRQAEALEHLERFLAMVPGTADVEQTVDQLREQSKHREPATSRR